ncbi:YheC/YheD family protein [Fictibacillus sp. KIGAM418]|uniref:YheC/YheD family protein n=1 Tax=Fictibacillus marinisediminis TaxID=2878389 RepID=A0A9X1XBA5_9BACL|nr:YheC/YheD family protein [Fictibacillus marinisediminis]MCK6255855.1 YheC/YheD family protein [Fictibacillus marinisediminis]
MQHVLPICKGKDDGSRVYVPEYLLQHGRHRVSLSFGSRTVLCEAVPHSKREIQLSKSLWDLLSIPFEAKIHVHIEDSRILIGPLVGIFTSGVGLFPSRPVGERSAFFSKLLSADRQVGAYYFVFGPEQLQQENRMIQGFFYSEKGWSQHLVPLPSIIYNQIPNRRTESSLKYQKAVHLLDLEWEIPFFNPSFFSKWEIFRFLQKDKEMRDYLPYTVINPGVQLIENMLNTYSAVFFKPIGGSHGRGILSVHKEPAGGYSCRFLEDHRPKIEHFQSLISLLKTRKLYGRLQDTLVQQGIDLITWKQRPVDFRVHTNKNRDGKWVASAMAAKIAGTQAHTTHLAYGGEIKRAEEVIQHAGLPSKSALKLTKAALQLSHKIDENISGLIGEIGFDFGLDQQGKVWLIEANSRPGRGIFSHSSFRAEDYSTRMLPLQYAVHLAKQAFVSKGLNVT